MAVHLQAKSCLDYYIIGLSGEGIPSVIQSSQIGKKGSNSASCLQGSDNAHPGQVAKHSHHAYLGHNVMGF
jgi:hypothetical protein